MTKSTIKKSKKSILKSKKGEMYIDTAFKILIAVVVGALIFNAVYALFNSTILDKLQDKVDTLFSSNPTSIEYSIEGNTSFVDYTNVQTLPELQV